MPVETVMEKPSFKHAWYNNQFALIPVQTIYEPFTVAALYEIVKIGEQIVRSMTMLTINKDDHPFMSQFHKPEDEKRSIVVIEPEHLKDWLNMTHERAYKLLLPMGAGYVAEHRPKPKKTLKTAQMDVFNG